jgi:hypothetical protein
MADEPRYLHRDAKVFYVLRPGEEWRVALGGKIVILHPDRPPFEIDGKTGESLPVLDECAEHYQGA